MNLSIGNGETAVDAMAPETIEQVARGVGSRTAEGLAIYPRGGGTALDYGGKPAKPGVALDLGRLDAVVDYPASDMTITVQAGMSIAKLQSVLAKNHQRLPIDAPQSSKATVGGVFATNSSGPRRFGWGRPRDWIIGVSFATAAGEIVKGGGRVVKNVAGYDFPKLLTGSMGTLGVITQATLKVQPIPEATGFVWTGLGSAELVEKALAAMNLSATRPAALELLNQPAAELVGSPLGLPCSKYVLAVGFEGFSDELDWQIETLSSELKKLSHEQSGGLSIESRMAVSCEPLWSSLTDFADAPQMASQANHSTSSAFGPISLVANLRKSAVVGFVDRLDPARWSVQVHAGNGIVRAHTRAEGDFQAFSRELSGLRKAAIAADGNLIVNRCPLAWKPDLPIWGEPRSDWELMKKIKLALDPDGLMNPGRFVGNM